MIGLNVSVSGMDEMQAALRRAEHETRRGATETVKWASILFAKSAGVATGASKKTRPIETRIVATARKSGKAGQRKARGVLLYKQGVKTPTFVVLPKDAAERVSLRRIRYRGAAKSSWAWALSKVGGRGAGGNRRTAGGIARNYVDARMKGGGGNTPEMTITNRMGWIESAFPGVVDTALRKAARGMVGQMDRKVQSALRRAVESGAR